MNRDQSNNVRKTSSAAVGGRPSQAARLSGRAARGPQPGGAQPRGAKDQRTAARVDTSGPAEKAPGRVTTTGPAVPPRQYHYSTSSHLERVQAKKRQNIAREAVESARSRAQARGAGQRAVGAQGGENLKGRVTSTGMPSAYHERGRVTSTGMPSGASRAGSSRISNTGAAPGSSSRYGRDYTADTDVRSSVLTSAMKAVIYIVFLLVAVSFLSYYAIAWGNDIFAFVKSTDDIAVTIPEYSTLDDIAEILGEREVIRYPALFKLYSHVRHKDQYDFVPGDYVVQPSQNYDQLIDTFRNIVTYQREEVTLTFPEGMTVDDMIRICVEAGVGTRQGFIDTIENGDFSDYWFVEALDSAGKNPNRKYRLEGYLYPDTYNFYKDSSEYTVLTKFLDNFEIKVDQRYNEAAKSIGRSLDEVLILASMIESEAKFVPEYTTISSVFHNRLDHPDYETQGLLQSDATIQYILPEHKSTLTHEDTLIDDPYNTYMYKGLPPGPICNPTLNAIDAALYPAWTNYYYFVAERSGYSLFAITAAEHEKNIETVRQQYGN